jgi:hypothetical protein
MSLSLTILGVTATVAGLSAIASRWESDNDADEEELERVRAKNARILKMRRAKLQKDRRKKAIQIELVAREKELKLVKRAEKLAQRYLDCGKREIDQFTKELQIANKNSIKLPTECVDAVMKELTGRKMDYQAALRRCKRHVSEVCKQIEKLNASRFYYKCVSCRRRFAVAYSDLADFLESRKGMKKCCDNCYPTLKKRRENRKYHANKMYFNSWILK